jgi:hypothetical protein
MILIENFTNLDGQQNISLYTFKRQLKIYSTPKRNKLSICHFLVTRESKSTTNRDTEVGRGLQYKHITRNVNSDVTDPGL